MNTNRYSRWLKRTALALMAGGLVGCGGGGGATAVASGDSLPIGLNMEGVQVETLADGVNAVKGIVLIDFKDGVGADYIRFIEGKYSLKLIGSIAYQNTFQFRYESMTEDVVTSMLLNIKSENMVLNARRDLIVSSNWYPNDPYYPESEWNDDYTTGKNWNLKSIKAKEAWDYLYHGPLERSHSPVSMGVIDNGFRYGHPDFKISETDSRLNISNDFVKNPILSLDSSPSHGMHVAGIMGAVGDNGLGIIGVAYKSSKIYACDGLGDNGHSVGTVNNCLEILGKLSVETRPRVVNLTGC
jgi:subtilisin family serine protease